MDFGFKFNIGEDVVFAAAQRAADSVPTTVLGGRRINVQRFSVVGRNLEECYGGIQRHYHLRAIEIDDRFTPMVGIRSALTGNLGLFMASEIELEAATPVGAVATPPE